MSSKLTKNIFIERSNIIHNNIYDYSKVEFINGSNKILIICKEHGDFLQNRFNHLQGKGCYNCGIIRKIKYHTFNKYLFLIKAKEIHGNTFIYDDYVYVNARSKSIITCRIHGNFLQCPDLHINRKRGCPKCSFKIRNDKNSSSTKEFIINSNIIHNNFYDYSEFIYSGSHNKGTIICPTHGKFIQAATDHLHGKGCKKCAINISNMETKWLDGLNISKEYRNVTLKINNKRMYPDAYDPTTNTIYEFYGDFWHGNPLTYNGNDMNTVVKKSFGELYQITLEKEDILRKAEYKLITIWEKDWKKERIQ